MSNEQPPHPTKWTVHVLGPDDLHFFDDSMQADTFAEDLEKVIRDLRSRPDRSEYDPQMSVVVIPPASES